MKKIPQLLKIVALAVIALHLLTMGSVKGSIGAPELSQPVAQKDAGWINSSLLAAGEDKEKGDNNVPEALPDQNNAEEEEAGEPAQQPDPALQPKEQLAQNSDQERPASSSKAAPSTAPTPKPQPAVSKQQPKTAPATEQKPQPASAPKQEPQPAPKPEPVSYVWGPSYKVKFRTEVKVTNTGSETTKNIRLQLPMLENDSPYQTTVLTGTSHPIVSTSGRVGLFHLGDLEPGESVVLAVNYDITIRPVSIKSTNETIELARQAFNATPGNGNCHALSLVFVDKARSMGLTARVVTGFKRPQSGNIAPGSLAGVRHSWAEFYVDGLGWVPVDLTFRYFASFPHASHVVETYTADQPIRINYKGGDLQATWSNFIL
ncbi:MAG: transglutaminase domain-containing protein [Dethiobacteria bacterium]|jgi:hypothetical protein|nr:transglutaminase domain-containing protein [Bacillota bacterium]HPT33610.1 transglutaminase domain-containing protein [Bacillota bacterium]HPZ64411.1 transglutaminase domain-containing protein [Bacillota bacterium]HQD06246.1 transglutaminase domain-containing protein [Bacillota bacterium]